MNLTINGPDRATLSLPFGSRHSQTAQPRRRVTPLGTLPRSELRRLVLEMLD
jgi:hypothetical protein